MTGYLTTANGSRYQLPPLLEAKLLRTGSVPCDSFRVCFPYAPEMRSVLETAVHFTAQEQDTVLLHAIIDECTVQWEESGVRATIEGRGCAALLLDNEVEGAVYQYATLRQLLERYASPLGISWSNPPALAGTSYSVDSGTSAWKALSDFTRRFGGWLPRFSATGELLLGEGKNERLLLDNPVSVQSMQWQERRYGVLSQVTVLQKKSNSRYIVRNDAFSQQGGQCSRVLYADSTLSPIQARQLGQQRIADSLAQRQTLELMLPFRFSAEPQTTIRIERDDWGIHAEFTLLQQELNYDAKGERTKLTLRKKEDNDVDF